MEGARIPELDVSERISPAILERLIQAGQILRKAERPVRVLRAVAWAPEVGERFLAAGAKELPKVTYTPLDAKPIHEMLAAARALIDGAGPVQEWLTRIADVIAVSADMLAAIGTKEFHR